MGQRVWSGGEIFSKKIKTPIITKVNGNTYNYNEMCQKEFLRRKKFCSSKLGVQSILIIFNNAWLKKILKRIPSYVVLLSKLWVHGYFISRLANKMASGLLDYSILWTMFILFQGYPSGVIHANNCFSGTGPYWIIL